MKVQDISTLVQDASKVIAHYWPMTAFVHHNPIRNLEVLPFDEAIQVARRFIGGRGYLANEMYRDLVKSGRITSQQIDSALESIAEDKQLSLGSAKVSQQQVLRAHMLAGITAPAAQSLSALVGSMPEASALRSLAQGLKLQEQASSSILGKDLSLSTWCDQEFNTQIEWQVNKEMIKWCEAFVDEGHASWAMPQRAQGFYAAWKSLAAQEWSPCGIADSSRKIKALPDSAEQALAEQLDALAIPEDLREEYISLQLTSLYGWASFINWRSEHGDYQWQQAYPIDLIQYLAVRLFYERELVDQACQLELGFEAKFNVVNSYHQANQTETCAETASLAAAWRLATLAQELQISMKDLAAASAESLQQILDWLDDFPETKHGAIWLKSYEAGYHQDLISKIQGVVAKGATTEASRPLAQLMFCIDVRSEPFRRSLEAVADYETIGFAGFFGIPISAQALDHHHETAQCPAILEPKYTIHEVAREGQCQAKHDSGKNLLHVLHEVFHDLKSGNIFTPYILVEALGWFFGLQMLERTVFPGIYRKWRKQIHNAIVPEVGTQMTADKDDCGRGLTDEEQKTTIETVLKMMGLTKNFGRLVVVAGHTSMSDNNPYEAALNCGACGGNSGQPNARLFAAIANKPEVRAHLKQNGIDIPDDSYFLAGVHNTTTDELDLYDLEDLPDSHTQDLERLQADLKEAAARTNQVRCNRLPGAGDDLSASAAVAEITRRSADWSETRPEWGLSGNAAFIIGRRSLTKELDLEGRSFLNSYDYQVDTTGALLEGILMGPMVVGQWINSEHYFSATDPEIYGAGSKIYHNVVGRLGVMSGPQSDLRTGLALQSVASGDMTYHEPLRLFVTVEAPRERIAEIVERQPVLKQLCDNEWIHLMAVDHDSDNKLYLYKQGWLGL